MDLNNGYTPAPKPLTPEEMKIRRKKELAIIKASNQMLEEAKNELLGMDENDIDNSKYADMPNFSLKDKIEMIDAAKSQNLTMANAYYNADENEVNAQEYGEPDAIEVKKYERRLKAKGLTDEQLRNKDITKGGISYGDENDKAKVSKGDGLKQKARRKRNTKKNAEEEKVAAVIEIAVADGVGDFSKPVFHAALKGLDGSLYEVQLVAVAYGSFFECRFYEAELGLKASQWWLGVCSRHA